jgi:hypothetical protein
LRRIANKARDLTGIKLSESRNNPGYSRDREHGEALSPHKHPFFEEIGFPPFSSKPGCLSRGKIREDVNS